MPAAAQVSRYPEVNPVRRSRRRVRMERWYMEATGATDGSIIAAIISPHMPTKGGQAEAHGAAHTGHLPGAPHGEQPGHRREQQQERRLRRQAPQGRGGGAHAAQENGAEWPFLPVLSNCSPKASTRDAVARAIVRVELAGWNMPVSFSTSPSGLSGGTKSSTSISTA